MEQFLHFPVSHQAFPQNHPIVEVLLHILVVGVLIELVDLSNFIIEVLQVLQELLFSPVDVVSQDQIVQFNWNCDIIDSLMLQLQHHHYVVLEGFDASQKLGMEHDGENVERTVPAYLFD